MLDELRQEYDLRTLLFAGLSSRASSCVCTANVCCRLRPSTSGVSWANSASEKCGLPNTTMSSRSPSNDGRLRVESVVPRANGRLHYSNQAILSFSLACSTHLVNFSSDQFSAMAVCWSVSLILTNVLPRA